MLCSGNEINLQDLGGKRKKKAHEFTKTASTNICQIPQEIFFFFFFKGKAYLGHSKFPIGKRTFFLAACKEKVTQV